MRIKKIQELYSRLHWTLFLRLMLAEFMRRIFMPHGKFFFAQGGEDIHILYLLGKATGGYYIDIGCNDPVDNSNTFKLYLQDWDGILVDGNPVLIEKARKIRKKDTCIHALVSNETREADFYIGESNLMSSIDAGFVENSSSKGYVPKKIKMQTVTLNQLIDTYVPAGKTIDLLSIDVEGHDFEVLQSLDLNRHRPRMIVVEDLEHSKSNIEDNTFVKYMQAYRYNLVSTDKQNLFFLKGEDFIQ